MLLRFGKIRLYVNSIYFLQDSTISFYQAIAKIMQDQSHELNSYQDLAQSCKILSDLLITLPRFLSCVHTLTEAVAHSSVST